MAEGFNKIVEFFGCTISNTETVTIGELTYVKTTYINETDNNIITFYLDEDPTSIHTTIFYSTESFGTTFKNGIVNFLN